MNYAMNTLAGRIKFFRKKNNFSQEILADKLNVSQSTIAKWEKGEQLPRSQNIKPLAEALNISSSDLLNDYNTNDENFHLMAGTQDLTIKQNGIEITMPYDENSRNLIKALLNGKEISINVGNTKSIAVNNSNTGDNTIH